MTHNKNTYLYITLKDSITTGGTGEALLCAIR